MRTPAKGSCGDQGAWKGVFHQTTLRLVESGSPDEEYQGRLMPLDVERQRRVLLLLRRSERKG